MYCYFGQKWSKLDHGHLWSVEVPVQSLEGTEHNSHSRDTMQVSGYDIIFLLFNN